MPDASYLVFLDCREMNLSQKELVEFFVDGARLALNDGSIFGKEGEGFMRLNAGCPRSILVRALSSWRKPMKTAASGNNNHKIKDTHHAPRQWNSFPEPCIGEIFPGTSSPAVFSPVESLAENAAARWKGNIRTTPSAVSPATPPYSPIPCRKTRPECRHDFACKTAGKEYRPPHVLYHHGH